MSMGYFFYRVLPFGLCNVSTTFQRAVLAIFADLEFVEIYMDAFFVFGDSFHEALKNLEKVLLRCQEAHLSLSDKKMEINVQGEGGSWPSYF